MELLPPTRLDPFTVSVAAADPPDPASVAVPRAGELAPELAANVTVPVGDVVPLAALTVTVSTVEALWAMLVGFAASEAVLAMSGAVTVTVTAAETELLKFVAPP